MELKKAYLDSIEAGKINPDKPSKQRITEKTIADAPELIKNYLRKCGYVDKPAIRNGEIHWENSFHRKNSKSAFEKLSYKQFNSVINVSRNVYIKSKITELLEKSVNGVGKWQITLMRFFKLIDLDDASLLAKSTLAMLLFEFSLLPSFFLMDGVTYGEQTDDSIVVNFIAGTVAVSGTFYFGNDGMITRFETDDRLYAENGKALRKVRWIGKIEGYTEDDGITHPAKVVESWELEQGEFDHFKGEIGDIVFNV
ncbi:MAG: DUF6544 family protein [Treponemataceae bacterium]